jgi:hypothetical protein
MEPHQQPQQDRRCRSAEQPPESTGRRGPLPEHPDNHRAKQGNNEKAKQRLNVIHDAGELHHQICRANACPKTDDRAPATYAEALRYR